jgi:peptidylprolyl isomerase
MKKAKKGDTVRVHFTASLEDGTKFASTIGEKPMELTLGDRKLIECFEHSVVGMAEGEQKTVRLEPSQTVGDRKPDLVYKVPRGNVPELHEDLKIGSKVQAEDKNGLPISGTVAQLTDHEVTIDANHPLAGETLVFDIELIEFV